jgi:predicted transcriptional regulator
LRRPTDYNESEKVLYKGNSAKSHQKLRNKYEMLTFILSGKIRIKIFSCLINKPCYAYEIAKKENLHPSSVIRSLKDLESKKIVECLNPKSYRQKFYQLTMHGASLKADFANFVK